MTQNLQHNKPIEVWRKLACQASQEEDPDTAMELAQQIVEKYEEEKRRKN
jgi:ubiquitin